MVYLVPFSAQEAPSQREATEINVHLILPVSLCSPTPHVRSVVACVLRLGFLRPLHRL